MAYLYRLAAYLLLVLSALLAWAPHAEAFPAVLTGVDSTGFAAWNQNEGERCAAWAKGFFDTCTVDAYIGPTEPPAWVLRGTGHPDQTWSTFRATGYMACPAGAVNSGTGNCTCGAGTVVNAGNNGCEAPPPPVAPVVPLASPAGKPYYFDARCAALCYKGICSAAAGCSTAVAGPAGPAVAIPNTCSGGSTPGEVNGIATCAKPDFTSFGKSSSSGTTAKDASGTAAAPSAGSVPDAATSETTSCTDAQCKTTSTSTTPVTAGGGGGVATTQVKVESKDDFCTRNPRSPGCTTDSSFGGGCGSFNGTGDALAVATARAVSDSKCALETLKGTEGYGAPALAAAGVDRPSDSPVNNKQIVDLTSMINKGNPFGESCVPDYPINVPKVGQIVIPLTAYCSVLAYLGKLLVGMSLLVGASIVAKRDA